MSPFERCVVLVTDDEPLVLKLVAGALTRYGYVVLPANSADEALQISREHAGPVHLALLDVMMPGMKGPELYELLRHTYPEISALFMSGFSAERVAEHLPAWTKVHFISKPFHPRDLVRLVNRILNNEDACEVPDEAEIAAG